MWFMGIEVIYKHEFPSRMICNLNMLSRTPRMENRKSREDNGWGGREKCPLGQAKALEGLWGQCCPGGLCAQKKLWVTVPGLCLCAL